MTAYIVLWGYVVFAMLFVQLRKLHPKYFLIMAFFGMTILLGLRGATVGEDTAMYLRIAESAYRKSWSQILSSFPSVEWNVISYGSFGSYSEKIETFYMIYNKLIMALFHNSQWVLIITAIITNILMGKFILDNVPNKNDIYLATYIYICDSFFMNSFNTMRQIFALSIAVQSIKTVKVRNFKKGIIWILVASLLHQSAILFIMGLLIYLIKDKRRYYKYLLGGVCAFPLFLPLFIRMASIVSIRYAKYLQISYWNAQVRGTMVLWSVIIAVIFVAVNSKQCTNFDWWLVYFATLYIGIEFIGLRLTVISRVALYFRIGLLLFFPSAKKFFGLKSRGVYEIAVIVLMTLSYFSYANSPARVYELWG